MLSLLTLPIQPFAAGLWEDKVPLEYEHDHFSIRLGGRVHADIGHVDDNDPATSYDRGEWRRVRLNLGGDLLEHLQYRIEYDFVASSAYAIKDAWLGYQSDDNWRWRVGNLQVPQGFDELTSSNSITFMERALPNALVPGYGLGTLAQFWGRNWGAAVGLFDGHIQNSGNDLQEGWMTGARAYYALADSAGRRLHLGLSVSYGDPAGDGSVSFSSRPESSLAEQRLIGTGRIRDVDHVMTTGLELAGLWSRWVIQGEYLHNTIQRKSRADVAFYGWYLQASWMLSGGQRDYSPKTGTLLGMRPRGRLGAWELAIRRSALDLEDSPVTGGIEHNWTIGLNWYLNRDMRVMLNWVDGRADPDRRGDDNQIQALQARFQWVF